MSIIRREDALDGLINLAYYIAQDKIEAAYRFLDAAEEAFRALERMPLTGTKREFKNPALKGIRMWRVKGFPKHLTFYREFKDGVEIIRVLHSARDIEALFSED